MAKENFDVEVSKRLQQVDKKQEVKDVKQAFRSFLEEPLPKEVKAYKWESGDTLIKVFLYAPTSEDALEIDSSGKTTDTHKVRYFPFARVLAAEEGAKYQPGDLVKLRDTEVMSIESSKYIEWKNRPYQKGNLKAKGEEPPKYISNIYQTYGAYTFLLNPFDLEAIDSQKDESIYKIPESKIENKVLDIDVLL